MLRRAEVEVAAACIMHLLCEEGDDDTRSHSDKDAIASVA